MHGRTSRATAFGAALVVVAAALAGCASEQNVEAFCGTMDEHKSSYLDQMSAGQEGGLVGLVTSVEAVQSVKVMWEAVDGVAPEEVDADVEAIRDAWQNQEALGADETWDAAIGSGMLSSGPMTRVHDYVDANCDGDWTVPDAVEALEPEPDVSPAPEPETETETEVEAGLDLVPEGPHEPLLTDRWTDPDGYQYQFNLLSAWMSVTKDVLDARPGYANIRSVVYIDGELENLTPERNAPMTDALRIGPVWSAESTICNIDAGPIEEYGPGDGDAPQPWCHLRSAGHSLDTLETTVPVGSALLLEAGRGTIDFPWILEVPEELADAVVADLEDPTIWVISRDEGDGLQGCRSSGGFYPSQATGDLGCD